MDRLTVFYQGAGETCGNAGWAYCLSSDGEVTSGPLPHRRPHVRLETLARSVRREFRGTRLAPLVAQLTAALRPSRAGDGYEATL